MTKHPLRQGFGVAGEFTKETRSRLFVISFVIVSSFVIRISTFEQSLVSQRMQTKDAETKIVMHSK